MNAAIPERLNILNLICEFVIHISILLQTTSWLHQRCDKISIDAYIFHKNTKLL